ncbi:MAG: response regulator [Desulfobacterales bacterium]|nr:response regulator [Desulfobacterales bacterium]
MHIMIIDEHTANLNSLKAGVMSFGYDSVYATNGDSALQFLQIQNNKKKTPKLVLMNMNMCNLNAVQFINEAKNLQPNLAFILMTEQMDKRLWKTISNFSDCDYIEKPFTPDGLVHKISQFSKKNGTKGHRPSLLT